MKIKMSTSGNGKGTKLMEMVFTTTIMVIVTKGILKMESNKAAENITLQMEIIMKVLGMMIKEKEIMVNMIFMSKKRNTKGISKKV